MPAQPSWHRRVPEILETLRAPQTPPFLDRPALESLFRLSRRQAIRLMGVFGGYQVGKTFLVDRSSVVTGLEQLQATGEIGIALERKRRVLAAVNEVSRRAAARRTAIAADSHALRSRPDDLPAAIEIVRPGAVQISYRSAEDLLARIVELASAATNDFPRFRALFEEPLQ